MFLLLMPLFVLVEPPARAADPVIDSICKSSVESINALAQDPLLRRFLEQTCGIKLNSSVPDSSPPKGAADSALTEPAPSHSSNVMKEVEAVPSVTPSPLEPLSRASDTELAKELLPHSAPTPPLDPLQIPPESPPPVAFQSLGRGLLIELSAYRHQAEGSSPRYSSLPTVGLTVRDERSIAAADWRRGLSGNIELALGETEFVRSGDNRNRIQRLQAEAYLPLSRQGFFAGLGYRRFVDDAGPSIDRSGRPEVDRLSEYVYLPMGWTSQAVSGWRSKLQFNYLLGSRQTDHYSQVVLSSDLRTIQRHGHGLDLRLENGIGWEVFARYWRLQASKPSAHILNGVETTGHTPFSETLELGVRRRLD